MSRIGIEVTMHEIHRDRKKASFGPFEFVLPLALRESGVPSAGEHVKNLLVEVMPLDESLALWDLPNRGVHMNVAREVHIYATPSNLGPGLDLLSFRIEDRIALHHWNFAGLDPVAIKIPFQAAAAADVCRTELLPILRLWKRLRCHFCQREVRHRKG